jgi:hypothetical protein
MKIKLLFIGLVLYTFNGFAQEKKTPTVGAVKSAAVPTSTAEITFSKDLHDFGTISKGDNGSTEFTFKNTGKEPLIIANAQGSCGCTVPQWPKEPIAPGATGVIKVKYDTNRPGPINKSVTISTNVTTGKDDQGNPSYYDAVIRIKGEVGPAPESGTPVNNTGAPTNN